MMRRWWIIAVAFVVLTGFLSPSRAQTSDDIAMKASIETTDGLVSRAPADESINVRSILQPAFAWAVGPWDEAESARRDAALFRQGGYLVRIVPNDSLTRFRVTVGHYLSEDEALDDAIGLPMTIRNTAEIIHIERHAVFTLPNRPDPEPQVQVPITSGDRVETPLPVQNVSTGPLLAPFEIQFSASTVFDSNINHDQEDIISSVGFVPGLMLRYRSNMYKPILMVTYGVAKHQYSQTEEWDRTSHMLQARLRPRLGGAFRTRTVFDISRNGTFEDRDLSDQIQAAQEFEYRFTRDYRLHAYGTLRWKYPQKGDGDAFKPNVGMVFEQRLNGGRKWEMGARYEINDEEISRGDYTRLTFDMDYEIPISDRNAIAFGIKHRRKYYSDKYVEVEGEDVLRRDTRWVLGVNWDFAITSRVITNVRYKYEARNSVDPGKPFQAHLLDFGVFVLL